MTMSRVTTLAVAAALLSVSACSALHKKTEAEPVVAAAPAETAAPAAEKVAEPAAAPAKSGKKSKKDKAVKAAASAEAAPAAEKAKPAETKSAVISKDEAMAIAARGNCLACHKIEAKVVGPAWKDVGAKYKGDAKGAATIASHIKAGGSFGWKFGVMPPRGGSQLSDADVEKMAGFIASLR